MPRTPDEKPALPADDGAGLPGTPLRRRPALRVAAAVACLAVLALATPLRAATTDDEEPPILTVTGAISPPDGGGGSVEFSLDSLEGIGTVELVTETPFTKGPVNFKGVPLRLLLERVGAKGQTVHAVALNDYAVDVPAEDATRFDVLLATRVDDRPLPIREKGPIWLVYPWSRHPELASPVYQARSIWQVRTLEVR